MEEEKKFEKWVREAIESLPSIFKEKLGNIQIIVENEPGVNLSKKFPPPYSTFFLGLYQGVPLIKRGVYSNPMFPDKITIFRRPIERICSSEKERREVVIKTVLHEIGHYFGLGEEELRKMVSKQEK